MNKTKSIMSLIFSVVFLCITCFGIYAYAKETISADVTVNGDYVRINGTVPDVTEPVDVTLLIGEPDNIIYINQITSDNTGSFVFEFPLKENLPSGEYPIKIGSDGSAETYTGSLTYKMGVETENSKTITANATLNEKDVVIEGIISNVTEPFEVTLLVGEPDNILYIDQISGGTGGTFVFTFKLPDDLQEGEYTYKIGSDTGAEPFEGVLVLKDETPMVTQEFVNTAFRVNIKNYLPTLTGTLSCASGKTVKLNIINSTDNTVIASDTFVYEDGTNEVSYTLPSLINPKSYTVSVKCMENEKELVSVEFSVSSSIILISATGNIDTADNVVLNARFKSVATDLIDKTATITAKNELSVTLPNVLANATYDFSLQGLETVKEEVPEPETGKIEDATEIPLNKNITLTIPSEKTSAWYKFTPKYSGEYSISSSADTEVYIKKTDKIEQMPISEKYTFTYPNEYYLQVFKNSSSGKTVNLYVSLVNDKTDASAFKTYVNESLFYSNINYSGMLYKNESAVAGMPQFKPASWLCNFHNDLYFNVEQELWKMSVTDSVSAIAEVNAKYIVSDENAIYFSNWSDGGKLYRGVPTDAGDMLFEKVCNDTSAWVTVNGDYLYYRNPMDRNRMYYIEKTATDATTGTPVRTDIEGGQNNETNN